MLEIDTSRPPHLGEVGEGLIETIRKEALKHRIPQFSDGWSAERGLQHHKALKPLLEIILENSLKSGPIPRVIMFDIDAHDVRLASAQRMSGDWHVDGETEGLRSRLVVADCLPTQVLVAANGSGSHELPVDEEELARLAKINSLPRDRALGSLGLEIYSPPAYQLVDIGNRLHRSPKNKTNETIQRTWLRISLVD